MRGDQQLFHHYDALFRECEDEAGPGGSPLDPHLRFVRKQNLTGLLQRLDSASMMSSIEGRTPFADVEVARLADSLPMSVKWGERGKQCVREAWRGHIPDVIDQRPKQSFPLPFQRWTAELAWRFETSPFAKTFYADEARRELAAGAESSWQLVWPMLNLALWGDSWWS
jgi:asparagine synthase (glutamine-hydrolysing)